MSQLVEGLVEEAAMTGAIDPSLAHILLEVATAITDLEALVGELREAGRNIMPYPKFTIGPESPGYHPTMPSAVAAFNSTLAKLEKARD